MTSIDVADIVAVVVAAAALIRHWSGHQPHDTHSFHWIWKKKKRKDRANIVCSDPFSHVELMELKLFLNVSFYLNLNSNLFPYFSEIYFKTKVFSLNHAHTHTTHGEREKKQTCKQTPCVWSPKCRLLHNMFGYGASAINRTIWFNRFVYTIFYFTIRFHTIKGHWRF